MNTSNTPPTTYNNSTSPIQSNVTLPVPKSDWTWPWFASSHGSQAAWIVLAFVLVILLLCIFGIKYRKLMMSNIQKKKSTLLKKKCDTSCLLSHLKFWKKNPDDTHIKSKDFFFDRKEYPPDIPFKKSTGINSTPQNDNLWKYSNNAIVNSSKKSSKSGDSLNPKKNGRSKIQTNVTFLPYENYQFASDTLDLQVPSFTSIVYNSPIFADHDEDNSTVNDIIRIESDVHSTHSNNYDNIDLGPFAPHASPNDDGFEVANLSSLHEMTMENLSEKIDNRRKLLGEHISNDDVTTNNTNSSLELSEEAKAFNENLLDSIERFVKSKPVYKKPGENEKTNVYKKGLYSELLEGKLEGNSDSESISRDSRNPNLKRIFPKTQDAVRIPNFKGKNGMKDVFPTYTRLKDPEKSIQTHLASKVKNYDVMAMDDIQEIPIVHKDIYPIHHVFDNDLYDLSHDHANDNQAIQAQNFLHNDMNLNLEPQQIVTNLGMKRSSSNSPTTSSTSRSADRVEEFSNVHFKKEDLKREGQKLESEQNEGIKGKLDKSKSNLTITSLTSRPPNVENSNNAFVEEDRKQKSPKFGTAQTKGLKRKTDISNSSSSMKRRKEKSFEFHGGKTNDNPLFQSADLKEKKLDSKSSDYIDNENELGIPKSLVSIDKGKNLTFLDHRDVLFRGNVSSEQSLAKGKELILLNYENKRAENDFDPHHENPITKDEAKDQKVVAHRFKHDDIEIATNGFTNNLKIYKDSFGIFYKGLLANGNMKIAVKVLSHSTRQRPSMSEISTLSQLEHPHLVKLLGFCKNKLNNYHVVYEWISGGSVDQALFDKRKVDEIIPWEKRFAVIGGVAEALQYLHENEQKAIIHRNVKANNVMLKGEKLGDFGLGWLMEHGSIPNLSFSFTNDAHQWIAPEFILSRKATTKMDVYSFGIFILEVVSGRRLHNQSNSKEKSHLITWILHLENEGKLLEAIDENLLQSKIDSIMKTQMQLILHLGILCSKLDPKSRPSMKKVNQILKGEISLSCIKEEEFLSSISPPINLFYPKKEVKNDLEEDNVDNSTEEVNDHTESKAIIKYSSNACLLCKTAKDNETSTLENLHSTAHPSLPDCNQSNFNSSPDASPHDRDEANHVSKDCLKPSQSVDYIPYDDHESQNMNIFTSSSPPRTSVVHCIDDSYSNPLPLQKDNTVLPMTLVPNISNYSTVYSNSSSSSPPSLLSNFDIKSIKPIPMLTAPSSNLGSNELLLPSPVGLKCVQSSNADSASLLTTYGKEIPKDQVSTTSPSSLHDLNCDIPNLKSTPSNPDTSTLDSSSSVNVTNKGTENILSTSSTTLFDQASAEPIIMETILNNKEVQMHPAEIPSSPKESKECGGVLLSDKPDVTLDPRLPSDPPCTSYANLSNSNALNIESVDPPGFSLPYISNHKILDSKANNHVPRVKSQIESITYLPVTVSKCQYSSSIDSAIDDEGHTGDREADMSLRDLNENGKKNLERRIIASRPNHPKFFRIRREDISSLNTDSFSLKSFSDLPMNFYLPSFHEEEKRFDYDPLLFAAFPSPKFDKPTTILPLPLLHIRSFEHERSFSFPLATINSNNQSESELQEIEKQDLVLTEMPSPSQLESSNADSLNALQNSEQIANCISSLPTPSLGDNI